MNAIIAAHGWQHSGWSGRFYPDDMPESWRLAFYANEFRALVLPESVWCRAEPDRVGEWVAESGADFRFFLETSGRVAGWERVGRLLGDRFGGVVARGGQVRPAAGIPVAPWPVCGTAAAGEGLVTACWQGPADPRGLRAALESLAPGVRAGAAGLLIVTGEPPDIEALRAAETIAAFL